MVKLVQALSTSYASGMHLADTLFWGIGILYLEDSGALCAYSRGACPLQESVGTPDARLSCSLDSYTHCLSSFAPAPCHLSMRVCGHVELGRTAMFDFVAKLTP